MRIAPRQILVSSPVDWAGNILKAADSGRAVGLGADQDKAEQGGAELLLVELELAEQEPEMLVWAELAAGRRQ